MCNDLLENRTYTALGRAIRRALENTCPVDGLAEQHQCAPILPGCRSRLGHFRVTSVTSALFFPATTRTLTHPPRIARQARTNLAH